MITIKTKHPEIEVLPNGQMVLMLPIDKKYLEQIETLPLEKELDVEIKEYKKPRSINANNYFWKLCDEVAKAIGSTKEDVYKAKIRECGVFEILPVKITAYEDFKAKWCQIGLGWWCEELDNCKLDGYVKVITYFGSSVYNSSEMSRVIDSIVKDCGDLNIPTLDEEELSSLIRSSYGKIEQKGTGNRD